jgi:hypothetical protein
MDNDQPKFPFIQVLSGVLAAIAFGFLIGFFLLKIEGHL